MDDMDTMTCGESGRLSFTVTRADPTAISVTVIFVSDSKTFSQTVEYDADGLAYFLFGDPDTDTVGVYNYQPSENFATGSPEPYFSIEDCEVDGECELPTLTICAVLPEGS